MGLRTVVALGIANLFLGTCGQAIAAPVVATGDDADRGAIAHILDDEGAAWAAGDADAFAAHVLPDVSFANSVGMFSVGKAPFVAQHKTIFSTIYKGSQMRQFIAAITFVKPDVAIVDTVTKLSGAQQLPTGTAAVDGVLYTRLEQVMVKRGGSWSVAAFHNVPIQPKFVTDEVRTVTSGQAH
ncbi:SgcJ/EcaC family oxidoreductase [Rhizorhabdus argentea]|uniref:SgcJ/EcaC family oxidoreductase n=1 Tax=Rhizorhabdus argentea TaxID=1387174 RepID=UPI0030ECDD22